MDIAELTTVFDADTRKVDKAFDDTQRKVDRFQSRNADKPKMVFGVDLSRFTRGMSQAQREVDSFGRQTAKATLDVTTQAVNRGLSAARRSVESFGNVKASATLDLDTSGLDRKLTSIIERLGLFNGRTVKGTVDLDTSPADSALDRLELRLTAFTGRSYTIPLNVDTAAAVARLQAFEVIRAAASRDIRARVDVDTGGAVASLAAYNGAAVASTVTTRVLMGMLIQNTAIFAAMAIAIVAASSALVPILGGMAVLGSMGAGAAIGIGLTVGALAVLKSGLYDGGYAMEALTQKAYTIRDAFVQAVGPASLILADIGMAAMDVALVSMPLVGPAATAAAEQMRASLGSFFDWLAGEVGQNYLGQIFAGVPEIMGQITSAFSSFSAAFIAIFAIATPYAVDLAYWIGELAWRFTSWVQSAEGTSQIIAAIEMAISVFQALWGMVERVVGSFLNFSMIAGPGLAQAFTAVGIIVSGLIDGLGWLWDKIGGLGVAAGVLTGALALIPGVGLATLAVIKGLALAAILVYNNWEVLGPMFQVLWDGILATFTNAWTWIQSNVMPIAQVVFDYLILAATNVYNWFVANWPMISSTVIAVFNVISQVWTDVLSLVFAAIVTAGTAIYDMFVTLWPQISPILQQVFGSATESGGLFQQLLNFIWQTAIQLHLWWIANWPMISAVITQVFTVIMEVWLAVGQVVFTAILTAVTGIVNWVIANWPMIQTIIHGVFEFISTVTWPMFQAILGFIIEMAGMVVNWFVTNWPLIQSTTEIVFNAISAVVSFVLNTIWSVISSIVSSIVAFWNANHEEIKAIVSAAWDIVKTIVETAISIVLEIIEFWMNVINGDWDAAWENIKEIIRLVWDAIWEIIKNVAEIVWELIKGFVEDVLASWEDFKDDTVAVFKAVANGMIDEFEGGVNGVIGLINKVSEAINTIGTAIGLELGLPTIEEISIPRMAKGGIVAHGPTGGIADGKLPHAVYGEVGKAESYTVHGRRDNLPYAQAYLNSVGMTAVPKRKRRGDHGEVGHPPHMAVGGILKSWAAQGVPMHAHGYTGWEDMWSTRTAQIARQTEAATGAVPNTYSTHPDGYEYRAPYSIDWWGSGGRGSPIGTALGDAVASYVASNFGSELSYYIWNGMDSWGGSVAAYDSHWDHYHGTFMGAEEGPGVGGSGGFAGWIKYAQEMLDKFTAMLPDFSTIDSMGEYGEVPREAGGELVTGATSYMKDKIWEWAKAKFGSAVGRILGRPSGEFADNVALGSRMAESYGWGSGPSWNALEELWHRESGWDHLAENPTSGAYGIPQALPGDKMASHGSDWQTNAATQISWGLDYIASRYSTPVGALAFHDANNWYAQGGMWQPGISAAKGGIVPGRKDQAVPITAHGQELIIPAALRDEMSNKEVLAKLDQLIRQSSTENQSVSQSIQKMNTDTTDYMVMTTKQVVNGVVTEENITRGTLNANTERIVLGQNSSTSTITQTINGQTQTMTAKADEQTAAQAAQTADLKTSLQEKLDAVFEKVRVSLDGIAPALQEKLDQVRAKIGEVFEGVRESLSSLGSMGGNVDALLSVTKSAWGLAAGGKVTHPTPAALAEHGFDEYVIPTEPKYRGRSERLLKEVSQRLGYGLVRQPSGPGMFGRREETPGPAYAGGGGSGGGYLGWNIVRGKVATFKSNSQYNREFRRGMEAWNTGGGFHWLPHYGSNAMFNISDANLGSGIAGVAYPNGNIRMAPGLSSAAAQVVATHEAGHGGVDLDHQHGYPSIMAYDHMYATNGLPQPYDFGMYTRKFGSSAKGRPKLPAFRRGGLVPGSRGQATGAVVHAGEMVLPVKVASLFTDLARNTSSLYKDNANPFRGGHSSQREAAQAQEIRMLRDDLNRQTDVLSSLLEAQPERTGAAVAGAVPKPDDTLKGLTRAGRQSRASDTQGIT